MSKLTQQLMAQAAANAGLGTIQTPPPTVIAPGTREQKRFTLTLTDGITLPIVTAGEFFRVEEILCTTSGTTSGLASPLQIKSDTGNVTIPILAKGQANVFPAAFNSVQITNPTGNGTVILTIWLGFGDYAGAVARVGPLRLSFSTVTEAVAGGAYTIGDAVGSGPFEIPSFFPEGLSTARIVRARLFSNSATTANGNFRLWLYGENGSGMIPQTDNAAAAFIQGTDLTFSPIEFPSLIATVQVVALSRVICDIDGLNVHVKRGGASASLWTQLEALAAYVSAAGQIFRVDLTAEFS